MMCFTICSIVEGHGEVEAVPKLLQRIAHDLRPEIVLYTPEPIRLPRTKVKRLQPDELGRAVQLAKRRIQGPGGIFIIMDADEDCPAILGPGLLQRAAAIAGVIPVGVVIAKVEFEAWFLAAAESIAGYCGLPAELRPPDDPEAIRGAKGWLDGHMPRNRKYSETVDQVALTRVFDLNAALRSPSFAKCYREVEKLLGVR